MSGCHDSAFLHTLPINILFEHHLEDNSEEANFISSSNPTSKNPATLNTQRVTECSWPTWTPWQNWRGIGAHLKCNLTSGLGQGHCRTSMDQGGTQWWWGRGVEKKIWTKVTRTIYLTKATVRIIVTKWNPLQKETNPDRMYGPYCYSCPSCC